MYCREYPFYVMSTHMKHTLTHGDKVLLLGERTIIMGTINCTPDSFSNGGQFKSAYEAVKRALQMVEEGACIIDIGGESTRPGSNPVPESKELDRVLPVVEMLRKESSVWISIDTYKARVAQEAIEAGADIINDISGLRFDQNMTNVAAENNIPVIVMHILGMPRNMQLNPVYDDVVKDIYNYFEKRIESLIQAGISKDNILIDPGIGFGKTTEHNLTLINNLHVFARLNKPILIGPSRKSFIGNILNLDVKNRLEGTAATVALSIARGAHIVRVHDVQEMVRVARITDAIINSKKPEFS